MLVCKSHVEHCQFSHWPGLHTPRLDYVCCFHRDACALVLRLDISILSEETEEAIISSNGESNSSSASGYYLQVAFG